MDALVRIIDANANRAREGLRVLEDLARFALNHAGLSAELKEIRHGLRAALETLPIDAGARLATRDTPGDVGTAISTPAEYERAGVRSIASAAAGRVAEALRSIEEASKALPAREGRTGADAARMIEAIRYRVYTAESRLVLALPGGTCPQWRLCVLLTASLCAGRTREDVARRAIEGGADCLQLREKSLDGRGLLDAAHRLVELAKPRGVSVIINDRPDIAVLCGADGVHVGQTDLGVMDVRRLAGFRLWVGVSTGTIEEAKRATADGADYCGVGPMFATTTAERPVIRGPEYLGAYVRDPATHGIPHLAIGGITPSNVGTLRAAGCRGVAVSSAVCGAADPAGVCRALVAGLASSFVDL